MAEPGGPENEVGGVKLAMLRGCEEETIGLAFTCMGEGAPRDLIETWNRKRKRRGWSGRSCVVFSVRQRGKKVTVCTGNKLQK